MTGTQTFIAILIAELSTVATLILTAWLCARHVGRRIDRIVQRMDWSRQMANPRAELQRRYPDIERTRRP